MLGSQETRKWFLDLGGQRKGPLSLREVETLLHEGAVFPTTPLTSNEPGAAPTTVQELLRQFRSSPAPSSSKDGGGAPSSTSQQFSDYDSDDPVTDLFNTYQAAKERTTKVPSLPRPGAAASKLDASSVLRWKWLAFVALGGLVLAGGVHFLLNIKQAIGPDETPMAATTQATPKAFATSPVHSSLLHTRTVPTQPTQPAARFAPTPAPQLLPRENLQHDERAERRDDDVLDRDRRELDSPREDRIDPNSLPDLNTRDGRDSRDNRDTRDGREGRDNRDLQNQDPGAAPPLTPANLRD